MIRLIKGFHDILPDETPKWGFIIRTAGETLERFGFREIITPVMERTELFERGIGQVTDIVEKEMYTFEDRSGDHLSLRPEATAGILRAVVEHSLLRREPILKVYTIGPMFRRERPSKGRFRQFFQINAEVLGDDSPFTDAEAITAAHAIMTNIGASGLMMEINSVGCQQCRDDFRAKLRRFLEPHLDELCPDCRRRYDLNPLRILDCKVDRCREIAKDAPVISDSLDAGCKEHFHKVQEILSLLEVPFRVEPRMVRGLDYYTRTAFEIIHEELGRSKAVGGGGRYDTLLKELGGPDASGIGFAIGVERLAMGMREEDPSYARRTDVYVAILGEKAREAGIRIVNSLRRQGLSAETRYSGMSLKAQMKVADKVRAKNVLMIGDDELARQEVTVRDMQTGDQFRISMDGIACYLQGDKR
ncbi:MAG: histidine--tRNA ligase [Desulfomonile tiedjei]|uniref:Histidine--tRNA ligase n=1 Tax=Desulfomonile tiedjei TaxID=2358 RepID=A0A9D6V3U1_9BACT|nr:histidine--tRNA ligase [Desulfomonile tiedjei]